MFRPMGTYQYSLKFHKVQIKLDELDIYKHIYIYIYTHIYSGYNIASVSTQVNGLHTLINLLPNLLESIKFGL